MLYLFDARELLFGIRLEGVLGSMWWLTTPGHDPFRIGFKPYPSPVNAFNNTEVDHTNVHGIAWESSFPSALETKAWPTPVDTSKQAVTANRINVLQDVYLNYRYTGPYDSVRKRQISHIGLGGIGMLDSMSEVYETDPGNYRCQFVHLFSPTWDDMRYLAFQVDKESHTDKPGHFVVTVYMNSFLMKRVNAWYDLVYTGRMPADFLKSCLPLLPSNGVIESGPSTLGNNGYLGFTTQYRYVFVMPNASKGRAYFTRTCEDLFARFKYFAKGAMNYFSPSTWRPYGDKYVSSLVQPYSPGVVPSVQRFFALRTALQERINQYFDIRYLGLREYDDRRRFSQSTQSAVDACRSFTGNGVALIRESFELKETAQSLIKLLQGRVSPRTISSLWLSMRYGLKLTALDTWEIVNAVVNSADRRRYLGYAVSRGTSEQSRCMIYYRPTKKNMILQIISFLREWDIAPSLTMLWDFIPYSFVVDWFVDVEGFLQALDSRLYMREMEVVSTLYTLKMEFPIDISILGLMGNIRVTRFRRAVYDEPIPPELTLSGSLPSFKNIIDGAALILGH